MIELSERRQAIDLVTLDNRLQRTNELESVGGSGLPFSAGGWRAARQQRRALRAHRERKSVLRSVIHATQDIQQEAMEAE